MAEIDKEELPDEFEIAFIDSDVLKYSAGFAAERTVYHLYDSDGDFIETFESAKDCASYLEDVAEFFGESVDGYTREPEKIIGEEEHALNACDTIIRFIKERVKAKEHKFYLSGKDNFRDKVATLYKYGHNRDNTPKPYWINSIVKHLKEQYNAVVINGIEADDAIGVGLSQYNKKGKKAIHIGVDKDIKFGIEGFHYDFKGDKFYKTTAEEALLFNYCQGIAGDDTDGFHGIPGIGLKKAEKILKHCTTEWKMYEASVEAYRKHFGDSYEYTSWDGKDMVKTPEELFQENMTLGWIMKKKGEVYKVPKKE